MKKPWNVHFLKKYLFLSDHICKVAAFWYPCLRFDVIANKLVKTCRKFLLTDSVCLKECQKKLRSLYETKNRVKIVPWEQTSAVDINKIYTDLSWVMDHRTPRGVTKEALNHYTEIFVRRELHPAPKRILVYGQPGKWGSKVS